jgi:hypothetical protein
MIWLVILIVLMTSSTLLQGHQTYSLIITILYGHQSILTLTLIGPSLQMYSLTPIHQLCRMNPVWDYTKSNGGRTKTFNYPFHKL